MKRLLSHLIFALLTFVVGVVLAITCERYNVTVKEEQAAKRLESERVVSPPVTSQGLSVELQRIDRAYKERCRIPDVNKDGWPIIKGLRELMSCNDEWAKARRQAIELEMREHLIQY